MSDPIVNQWKQQGVISVWKYKSESRDNAGWHFSANSVGCRSLRELIGRLKEAKWSSNVNVIITHPSKDVLRIPGKMGGEAPVQSPSVLKVHYIPNAEPADKWELELRGMDLSFSFGPTMLQPLEDLFLDTERGQGDYSIGGEDAFSRLWCWEWGGREKIQ